MPRPLSKFMGGKQKLASQLVPLMPPHYRYIEGFSGMASVFLAKPKAQENIINDLNDSIITLFEVVRDTPEMLIKMIELAPYSTKQYEEWCQLYLENRTEFLKLSKVKRAFIYYYILACSFNSEYVIRRRLKTFSFETASVWGSKNMIKNIRAFSAYVQGVVFTNMDYKEIIRKYAVKDTFVYLDPPYTMAKDRQYYEFNFTPEQHKECRDIVLANHKETGAQFMLSYDDHEDIWELFSIEGFHINVIKDVPQASNFHESGTRVRKNELVITTYNIKNTGLFYA